MATDSIEDIRLANGWQYSRAQQALEQVRTLPGDPHTQRQVQQMIETLISLRNQCLTAPLGAPTCH